VAVLIDTDVLVDRERGAGSPELEALIGDEERAISVITVSELLHGVHRARGGTRTRRRAFVEHLLASFEAIPVTESVARIHAEVWAHLADRGESIGAHDLWIAATALAHGLGIATGNAADFERVPGLRVLPAPR
jgi:tRNA(fMet)-specific endonuclease VapC